eukprot:TRINITY_DN4358_c0_g1_i2.p1 TRINITY_DN4358_c0_g1~~TRINITY_DN4358_c0_g1_i2.p1  ORF type:complete len:241 (+),score=51.13 TRINITY_DN4358_c0_g1_i2:92-814(+)
MRSTSRSAHTLFTIFACIVACAHSISAACPISADSCKQGDCSALAKQAFELAEKFTAAGSLSEAAECHTSSLELQPNDYMTLFKRAVVNMRLNRLKICLSDLDKIVRIKPDFIPAYTYRGRLLLQFGRFQDAHSDYSIVLKNQPSNEEARQKLNEIASTQATMQRATKAESRKDWNGLKVAATDVIEVAPFSVEAKLLRMRAHQHLNMVNEIAGDASLESSTQIISPDVPKKLPRPIVSC